VSRQIATKDVLGDGITHGSRLREWFLRVPTPGV
jgi:hypothetical protein